MTTEALKGTKAHQRYRLQDGTIVPGVTTITGILNKPGLVKWANNLGLQGIDVAKYVDQTAIIGTCAHEMVQEYLGGPKVDRTAYTPEQLDKAENALLSFFEWEKAHKMKTVVIEQQLVSEVHRFGGSIDWYGEIDGRFELVDFKTSSAIYPEHKLQVAGGYTTLLLENGYRLDGIRIIRIGRDESENWDQHIFTPTDVARYQDAFLQLVRVYYTLRDLKAV